MSKPVFSISPALTSGPRPVTLTMPATGLYTARAFVTDPCGHAIPGASVSVRGLTATPHGLPAGTSFVDWSVSAAHPAASGGRISLVLASRQVVGRATTCHTGPGPYAGTHHHTAAAPAGVTAAAPHGSTADALLGLAFILAALAAAGYAAYRAVRRIRRHRGGGKRIGDPGRKVRTRPAKHAERERAEQQAQGQLDRLDLLTGAAHVAALRSALHVADGIEPAEWGPPVTPADPDQHPDWGRHISASDPK
jgi:hypothetical protein